MTAASLTLGEEAATACRLYRGPEVATMKRVLVAIGLLAALGAIALLPSLPFQVTVPLTVDAPHRLPSNGARMRVHGLIRPRRAAVRWPLSNSRQIRVEVLKLSGLIEL
jgi:hypothetical protein